MVSVANFTTFFWINRSVYFVNYGPHQCSEGQQSRACFRAGLPCEWSHYCIACHWSVLQTLSCDGEVLLVTWQWVCKAAVLTEFESTRSCSLESQRLIRTRPGAGISRTYNREETPRHIQTTKEGLHVPYSMETPWDHPAWIKRMKLAIKTFFTLVPWWLNKVMGGWNAIASGTDQKVKMPNKPWTQCLGWVFCFEGFWHWRLKLSLTGRNCEVKRHSDTVDFIYKKLQPFAAFTSLAFLFTSLSSPF